MINEEIDFHLDITRDVCPLTFVKAKLLLEKMAPGQTAEIRLQGAEPLENVPRSVRGEGHAVLSLRREDPEAPPLSVHRLIIRKASVQNS